MLNRPVLASSEKINRNPSHGSAGTSTPTSLFFNRRSFFVLALTSSKGKPSTHEVTVNGLEYFGRIIKTPLTGAVDVS